MNKKVLRIIIITIPLIIVLIYGYFYTKNSSISPTQDISTFEECAAAGYPIMESYPERCSEPGGETFIRVATDQLPTLITLTGIYTCLPKKNTGGPITLECAFGLKTNKGYYSLDMSSLLTDNYPALYGNEKIMVEGVLVPKELLSSDHWENYDVIGVISVEKVAIIK